MKLDQALAARKKPSLWARIYDVLFGYHDRLTADWNRRYEAGENPDPCEPGGPRTEILGRSASLL